MAQGRNGPVHEPPVGLTALFYCDFTLCWGIRPGFKAPLGKIGVDRRRNLLILREKVLPRASGELRHTFCSLLTGSCYNFQPV